MRNRLSINHLNIDKLCTLSKGNVALGGHFATLSQKVDFYKTKLFFHYYFQKEKANTFTLLIILIVKNLQIELNSTNLLL